MTKKKETKEKRVDKAKIIFRKVPVLVSYNMYP